MMDLHSFPISLVSVDINPIPKFNIYIKMYYTNKDVETSKRKSNTIEGHGSWTKAEHERFLVAIQIFPEGPWKAVAEIVQTRTPKQTQTHAQKCREKIARKMRGLRKKHTFASKKKHGDMNHNDLTDDSSSDTSLESFPKGEYKAIRTKHSINLMLPALHPIPFDGALIAPFEDHNLVGEHSGSLLSFDETMDFLIAKLDT